MKRLFAMMLALTLVLGYIPVPSLAEETTETTVAPTEEMVTEPTPVTVTGISVAAMPTKTSYQTGDSLELTGGSISIAYSDGTAQTVEMTGEMVSGFNNTVACTQTLTVTYEGFEADFDVTVTALTPSNETEVTENTEETNVTEPSVASYAVAASEKEVSWIDVTPPTKRQYVVNQDELDVSGGFIRIVYTDDTEETIPMTTDMVSGFDNTTVGTFWLSFYYHDYHPGGYRIAIVESEDQPLVIETEVDVGNSKTVYYQYDSIQLDGATLILTYSDGTIQNITITSEMIPSFRTNDTGWHSVPIQYEGETRDYFSYQVITAEMLSGSCGTNAFWEISDDGVLRISGSGEIETITPDWYVNIPWNDYRALIKAVIIEEGITAIGQQAFWGCENLARVELPSGLEKIESNTFGECSSLITINIPDSVTEIGYNAFNNCTSLTSITFPQSVTDIGSNAFAGCTGLTEIIFPEKLDFLGSQAFANCTNLKKITFAGKESPSGSEIFEGVTATGYYPGTTYWDDWFFENCGGDIEWIAVGEVAESIKFDTEYLELYTSGEGRGWTLYLSSTPGYVAVDCEFTVDNDIIQLGETSSTYCTFSTLKTGTATITATDKRSGCTATATIKVVEPKEITCPYTETIPAGNDVNSKEFYFTPEESGIYNITVTSATEGMYILWTVSSENGQGFGSEGGSCGYLEAGVQYTVHIECASVVTLETDSSITFKMSKASEITGIKIVGGDRTFYAESGEEFWQQSITAQLLPENAIDAEITWESSNPQVLAIWETWNNSCEISTVGSGSATLTAKCGDFTDSIAITTQSPQKLELNVPVSQTLTPYENYYFSFTPEETGRYAFVVDSDIAFGQHYFAGKYMPEDIESIDSGSGSILYGNLTAGVTYYFLTQGYDIGKDTCSSIITVKKYEQKPVAMELSCLYSYDTYMNFGVNFVPTNSYDKIVSWESSNTDILDIRYNNSGSSQSFYIYGSGEVTITAVSESGLRASCTVTVGQCYNGHTYGPWKQIKAKTCTTDGQEMATCICGLRQYRATPAGHDFVKGTCIRCGISGGTCGENVTWILDGEGVLTISGTGAMDQIGFDSVTGQHLPPWKDWQDRIKSVVIESGVTDVVDQAFGSCGNLETIVIPATVTKLGDFAILSCPSLQEIQVDAGNQHYCTVDGVLYSKDMTTLIKYPACRPGTEYTVPDSVTKLMHVAFDSASNLVSITLPDNITALDTDTFADCTSLKNIRLPKNLTDMEAGCIFWNCSSLESIEIPDNVQVIGSSVFAYCPNLKQVTLPASLKKLADHAFGRCENLETITIPAGVNCLENKIFEGSGLKEITFEGDAPKFDEDTFSAVTATAYYVASNPTWITDVMQDYGGNITWVPIQNRLNIDKTELGNHTTVWIDGVEYAVQTNGDQCYINILDDNARTMITYSYNAGNGSSNQLRYPIGMKVWTLENENGIYTATRQEAFNDILQYSGMSIRVTGKKGIRMITSIDRSKKNALISDGLAGYTLKEYGTAVAWANQLSSTKPLTLGQSYVMSNYAYKKGVADPVFQYTDNQMQYTNVLVNFSDEQCKYDMALRPYMILEDSEGEALTIYGGIVYRSIGYIAYQNRNIFEPQTDEYNYIWDIIHYVYGDIGDDEFIHAWTPSIK